MEAAVLDRYQQPYDHCRPLVCLDEKPVSLHSHVRTPLSAKPGVCQRTDYEYRREGTANPYMESVYDLRTAQRLPSRGGRHLEVTERRTKQDFARILAELADRHYPSAERIQVVCDNLNIHTKAVLYEALAPEEARRIARRIDLVFTPKHGSWLNMAEIEISVFELQCLNRRIESLARLAQEAKAWQTPRNRTRKPVNWRFTTEDARIKLRRLYPSIDG